MEQNTAKTSGKLIAQGAEAKIFLVETERTIIKNRISKGYRLPELDERLRKQRTKSEAKILEKAKQIGVNVPNVKLSEKFAIYMEHLDGDRLSEKLNSYNEKKQFKVMEQLGEQVAKLHDVNIIHGDLTTSNVILKKEKVFIIDFGLGFQSTRIEDRAVDLHLIKQALEAKHFQNHEKLFESFLKGYNSKDREKVLLQLTKVEGRGRYKH